MTDISKEYASALFMLAAESGNERAYLTALESVLTALTEETALTELFSSPAIPMRARIRMLGEIFGARLPEQVVSFLQLLCEKGRMRCFPDCVREYSRLLQVKEAVTTAKITSALPLTEEEKTALIKKLETISGNTVLPSYTVAPEILGGVIVEMNGKVMDGSLRHRLGEIKDVMNQ